MKILAIETSCDDTAIAILEVESSKVIKFKVLANVVSSQHIHANYGGVFPMMAKREHQKNIVPVLAEALKQAGLLKISGGVNSPRGVKGELTPPEISAIQEILQKEQTLFEDLKKFLETHEKPEVDAIAVTHGPGLEPCLWVGINTAKVLSLVWNVPIIPVNHIEAHILVNFLGGSLILPPELPAMALVVSGGHTQLILVKNIGEYEIIGETRDDAAGECFDKAARILGLGYPGGPIIAKYASELTDVGRLGTRRPTSITLPRPMMNSKDYNFSFSGLKTAVLYRVRDMDPKIVASKEFINQMCFAVQDAICDVLIKKTMAAAKEYNIKTIILGGGVSANSELRSQFKVESSKLKIPVIFPEPKLSTDNALMIAVTAFFHQTKKIAWQELSAHANLRVGL